MAVKHWAMIFFTLVCLVTLGGCWDHLEMQNMLIVAGIGLDAAEDGEGFGATVEVVCVESNGGDTPLESKIVEGKGDTVYGALQNAMNMTGGVMYGNHCKVLVLGESLARGGIDGVADYILRSTGLNKFMEVAVAREATAKSILTGKTVKNEILSYELAKLIGNNAKYLNNTSKAGVYKLNGAINSPCAASVVPAVFIKENNGKEVLCAQGLGVLLDGRLKGFLSGEQSNIYNIVMSRTENGYLVFREGSGSRQPSSAKIFRSSARFTPHISDGKLSLTIFTDAAASPESFADADASGQNSALLRALEGNLSYEIEKLVKDVQREYGADVFGFYKEFEDGYRREWKTLSHDWPSYFREIEVRALSRVRLTGTGKLRSSSR